MKRILRLLFPALLATMGTSPAAHYQVYLLGGQSNGNGRADAAQLTAPLAAPQSDVRFYWHRTQAVGNVGHLSEDQWIDLAPGSGHGTGLPVFPKEFGSEVSFGREMAEAKPAENIAIIKYTHGGTNLASNWSATGIQYTTFVSTVQAALAALTSAGHTYALRGMLWHQGEADTGNTTSADNYQANLTSLIARVRGDLFAGGPLPFVIGTLSNSQYGNITTPGTGAYKVRQAQQAVAAADPAVGLVITDGYGVRSDVIHFDHNGQIALGQDFANRMLALEEPASRTVLYSTLFGGSGGSNLNGQAVTTSGATPAQHALYGTSASATWTAATKLKADGSYTHTSAANTTENASGTLAFTPRNGFVYTLTMTTNVNFSGTLNQGWFATGFFMQPNFSGAAATGGGATAWSLTRPGNTDTTVNDQVAHSNLAGGAGAQTSSTEDTTAPTTLRVVLHTTAGTGDWSAQYFVGNDLLASVADLGAVDIESVGIAVNLRNPNPGRFQAFELSVAGGDLTAPLITLKSPADNASEISRAAPIVATFDDYLIPGSGNIVIKDLVDGSTTRTIAVTDASQVTVSGKALTIDPTTPLAAGRAYAVQIAAGALKNFSGLPFAGIPETNVTLWNFQTREQSPNVIFILGDDHAWYDYSFMRQPGVEQAAINLNPAIYPVAQTPAIDRLANEGLAYTRGYTTPLCRPSLASIITGAFPHRTRITGNDLVNRPPDEEVEARMQVLHPLSRTLVTQLGYTAFQTGKWWEGHHTNGGFTHGDTVNSTGTGTQPAQWGAARPSYVTARHGDWGLMTGRVDYVNDIADPAHPIPYANTIQTATAFMTTQVAADHPFFLWYAPFLAHTPHDPPAGLLSKYDALINEPDEAGDYFAKYYANVERFDGGVGAILDYLDDNAIADNTIVVLIADNGWINLSNTGAYAPRSKTSPYEGGIRTPILVRWPDRIKAGGAIAPQVVTTPVSLVDLVPTIHDALGLPTYPEMTGVSLLKPAQVAARDTVFTEDSNHDMLDFSDPVRSLEARVAVRDGWKLILPFDGATRTNGSPELYQLYNSSTGAPVDPHETANLAAGNPARVAELTVAIEDWYAGAFGFWISHPSFGLAPTERGFAQDPDGDGLASGLEAWFGSHPGKFNTGLSNPVSNGTVITFTHPKNENPPAGISGFYQWSPNLTDWYAGDGVAGPPGGPTLIIVPHTVGTTTTVTATASAAMARIFLRAVVIQN